ncbi:MAG: 16S rRNA (uracil(1498)-N(3))-methyltransferase [Rickettsiales bacterium]|jgi:16S rRNA (uracil1498-N3)-methyltransferase|nr:16S rRNA (uracil(1498)-N(3))-methyltransferase [Rickettsiales bacterium]
MTVISIFTGERIVNGGCASLDRVHYIVNVMRRKVGDRVRLVNGSGKEFFGIITKITKNLVEVSDIECLREEKAQDFLGLIFSPIHRLDTLIKMATELGITNFMPFRAQHGQVRYNHSKIKKNIVEAIEQSERLDFPALDNQQSLANILDRIDPLASVVLFCEERNSSNPRFPDLHSIADKKVYVIIGPEGGFSKDEISFIKSYSFVIPVSLGKNILKTETAAASIISLVKYFQSGL